jgi:hypothetical protein
MVSAVSSSSAALKVLQVQLAEQAASGSTAPDPLKQALDPRSLVILPAQSFDALLKVRAELRGGSVSAPQAPLSAPSKHPSGGSAQTSMLAATESESEEGISSLDDWYQHMEELMTHSKGPLNSALMPWNSPDVIQQLKDKDAHRLSQRGRAHQIRANDALVRQSMAATPADDAARIRAFGGEVWYEDNQTYDQISDKEFFRNVKNLSLYGGLLRDPIDPTNEVSQAFLNGTAQIIRGSKIPEVQYKDVDYQMYAFNSEANRYTHVGQWGHWSYNHAYEDELARKNPTMNVTLVYAEGDIAFILFPKTGAAASAPTAVAQGTGTALGTKPVAASAR